MYKALLIFILILKAWGVELFLERNYPLSTKKLSKEECIKVKDKENGDSKICQKYSISYLVCDDKCSDELKKAMEVAQKKLIAKYEKSNPKKDVIKAKSDFLVSNDLYENIAINLFAETPNSFTFSIDRSSYTGGAHDFFSRDFINVDKRNFKILNLKELFKPDTNQTLHKIAEKYYKLSKNLSPSSSLKEDRWFENKFVLAKNFAVTNDGLFFLYNPYEIKSYADRKTEFLLPYEPIKSLIKKKSPISFIFQRSVSKKYIFESSAEDCTVYDYYEDAPKMRFYLDVERSSKGKILLTFTIKNIDNISYHYGLFTVSFPTLKSTKAIKKVASHNFVEVYKYGAQDKIYNQKEEKSIRVKYPMVEGVVSGSSSAKEYDLVLEVDGSGVENLVVNFRFSFKKKGHIINIPEGLEGVESQQGFANFAVVIPLKNH
jgi:hypothetical protein